MMTKEEIQEGITVVIDKPYRWTSFDVVNKIRWNLKQALKVKNIKVGHAGTLDPLATGVLIICIGKHTKKIDQIMSGIKSYEGTILLGKTTPCYDLEKDFDAEFPTAHITKEMIEEARKTFLGEIDQVPPLFSAKQIDGKRAYDIARAGQSVELKANKIFIEDLQLDDSNFPEIKFTVTCSKGTYIRSIARDLGEKLQSGATLTALRRTSSGDFHIKNAYLVEDFIKEIESMS